MATTRDGPALHKGIEDGNIQLVQTIVHRIPESVNHSNDEGWTPLHTAVRCGNETMVILLLEAGAAVNATTKNRNASALMLATSWGMVTLISRLIEWGADVNQASNERWDRDTPLHKAAALEACGPLHLLLLRGAAVNTTNCNSKTPLDVAIEANQQSNAVILREFRGLRHDELRQKDNLYSHGIRSRILEFQMGDFLDQSGKIHLDAGAVWATQRGQGRIVEYLLDIDATLVDIRDDDGWQLLHHASWKGHFTIVQLLLTRGAETNKCTLSRVCTPLHLAAQRGHESIVQLLLEKGSLALARTRRGSTARMLAVRGGHQNVATLIDTHLRQNREQYDPRKPTQDISPIPRTGRNGRRVPKDYQLQESDENDSFDEISEQDGHDGHLSAINSDFVERRTFSLLITTWKDWLQTDRKDYQIKVAVLDTGLDLKNRDLRAPRVEAFYRDSNGNLTTRLAESETSQSERIKGKLNLATKVQTDESNIQDLDGHGTRVAGIILRLAPTADLYIARVCDGKKVSRRGTPLPTSDSVVKVSTRRLSTSLRQGTDQQALEWAIDQQVDIVNLSLGFDRPNRRLRDVATRAKEAGILIFAAMSNSSLYADDEWPAADFATAIGIHSCKSGGTYPSEFTAPTVPDIPNFLVAGENIITHKFPYPTEPQPSITDRFEQAAGNSYATPIATAMAAMILTFVRQQSCRSFRRKLRSENIDPVVMLKDHRCMATLLEEIARPTLGYFWISPKLLWVKFEVPSEGNLSKAAKEHAWDCIYKALVDYKAK
ncbi:hypothetical protein NM208_g1944 [Fusarium decemcellulare]|uniref:Uncharacterized protein n=1 Tax=Fusarium decemcellulare TaxID=57161 RepID=A0ACC1SU59_9HYPO|nr:hypothetical protein NM208_g1944 [Fusarium decemcellulare]